MQWALHDLAHGLFLEFPGVTLRTHELSLMLKS
jgi:hypothetical protein